MPETESDESGTWENTPTHRMPEAQPSAAIREKASAKNNKPLQLVVTPRLVGVATAVLVWGLLVLGGYLTRDAWLSPMMPEVILPESLQMMIVDQVEAKAHNGTLGISGVYQNLTEDTLILPPLRLTLVDDAENEYVLGDISPSEATLESEAALPFTATYTLPDKIKDPTTASLRVQFTRNPKAVDQ